MYCCGEFSHEFGCICWCLIGGTCVLSLNPHFHPNSAKRIVFTHSSLFLRTNELSEYRLEYKCCKYVLDTKTSRSAVTCADWFTSPTPIAHYLMGQLYRHQYECTYSILISCHLVQLYRLYLVYASHRWIFSLSDGHYSEAWETSLARQHSRQKMMQMFEHVRCLWR